MTEYELDKWCEQHCAEDDPNCFGCPAFAKYLESQKDN